VPLLVLPFSAWGIPTRTRTTRQGVPFSSRAETATGPDVSSVSQTPRPSASSGQAGQCPERGFSFGETCPEHSRRRRFLDADGIMVDGVRRNGRRSLLVHTGVPYCIQNGLLCISTSCSAASVRNGRSALCDNGFRQLVRVFSTSRDTCLQAVGS